MPQSDPYNSAEQTPYRPSNLTGLNAEFWDKIQSLRLLDDILMRAVLDDNVPAVQLILRIILQKPDLKVTRVQIQREYKNMYGRSVRLDVEAVDDTGKLYNIEVQKSENGAEPERLRYNSALMDAHALLPGDNPVLLPETYVVMIAEKDVLKRGLPVYHIDRIVQETGEPYGDRAHIVIANGAFEGETDIGNLMADFRESDPSQMHFPELSERIRAIKFSEEGITSMSKTLNEWRNEWMAEARNEGRNEGRDEGRNEGRGEGQIIALSRMILKGLLTATDAAADLNLSVTEFCQKAAVLGYQFPAAQ